ncbi:MAG: flagellar hook-associated protein FlgK [Deltaproteobacteria bacterium]|nr:flagellar hook-associated protein FlgK [Deltaproteobacteria bacterium]
MSGIGLVLNIAKDALLTQQYALDVVSHNIANVNTDGYTRQTAILTPRQAAPYGGFIFGRGVMLYDIARNTNDFIEKRLQDGNAELLRLSEKSMCMNVMETLLNENSSRSLSNQLVDFWNAWNDLSNDPSGAAQRNILTESGAFLAQSFNDIRKDLDKLDCEIDNSIDSGISKINEILVEIADLNKQIILAEINGNANDLRDRRNVLVNELAQYIDINTYEYEDGNLTVTTGRGFILVDRTSSYSLEFDADDIKWQSSTNREVTISETIVGGKLGGWLDIRDEIIPKYSADLDELARSIMWEVNRLHTQGVGLTAFSAVTGAYAASESGEAMGNADSGLDFSGRINDGSFKIWLYDTAGSVVGERTIAVQAGVTTLNDLAETIENIIIAGEDALRSSVMDGRLHIEIDTDAHPGYAFGFSDDTGNILASLGINTFFKGSDATDISVNDTILDDNRLICAALINNSGEFFSGDNNNALAISNLQFEGITMKRWTYERGSGATSVDVNDIAIDDYLHLLVGSIGIQSQSFEREREYKEVIFHQISQTRDNISAVSLDEEMANLIRHQQAYATAAKLITTAEEMLETLLNTI